MSGVKIYALSNIKTAIIHLRFNLVIIVKIKPVVAWILAAFAPYAPLEPLIGRRFGKYRARENSKHKAFRDRAIRTYSYIKG